MAGPQETPKSVSKLRKLAPVLPFTCIMGIIAISSLERIFTEARPHDFQLRLAFDSFILADLVVLWLVVLCSKTKPNSCDAQAMPSADVC